MAANDLINVYNPAFWAQETLMQLFPMLKFAGMVHRDFENVIANQGDVVNTRMPNKFTARDADPDNFLSNKPKADNVQVQLNKWKEVTFEIGDKEASLSMKDLVEEFASPAAFSLAEAVEDATIEMYKDTFYTTGAAGTTPATVAALGTDIQQKFDEIHVPGEGRQVVLNPAAVNKFNQVFYQDYVSGSPEQQTTGALRPKFGMRYENSNKLPRHTRGTAWDSSVAVNNVAGYDANPATNGALPGTSTIAIDGLTASKTILKGDLISIAHGGSVGTQTYVVTADTTSNSSGEATITITPGLAAAVADDAVITAIADHDVNLAFNKQAFALVSRPLKVPNAPGAGVYVAQFNGLGLRTSVWYEAKDKRTYVSMDLLFGVKTLDPRKAIRVLG